MVLNPVKHTLTSGGKYGLSRNEKRDPIGLLVAGLQKVATSNILDRLGIRKAGEDAVYRVTNTGFRAIGFAGRTFARVGKAGKAGKRVAPAKERDLFDLTPSEDEQLLTELVRQYATEAIAPVASQADEACTAPAEVLKAAVEIGLPILGVNEELGGIATERSSVASVLVHEALAQADMGIAVATMASGAVATALALWGDDQQQATYLPAFASETPPVAALALAEATSLFDTANLGTRARRTESGYILSGTKAAVVRGNEAELFILGAVLEGSPRLFVVESNSAGLSVIADPTMGVRAAGWSRLELADVEVGPEALLGTANDYTDCVQYSRLAWCALAVGTGQAVLDYVIPYVKERHAFGEPIAHRQAVAFKVANIEIELQGMRLATYRAASRIAQGKNADREIALARQLCTKYGMQIGLDGVQLLGGHGYVKEHPVERWYRDLRAIGVMEGAVLV